MLGTTSIRLRGALPPVLACLLGLAPCDLPADIYKQVQPDGTVSYSSEPLPDAEKIDPPLPQVIPSLQPSTRDTMPSQAPAAAPSPYAGLDIVEPADDQVIWNNAREIEVGVSLTPPLKARQGHRLVILLDGRPVEGAGDGTRLTLPEVDRGAHTLSAEVHDAAGRILIQSAPVTFHLKQHSSLFPGRRSAP